MSKVPYLLDCSECRFQNYYSRDRKRYYNQIKRHQAISKWPKFHRFPYKGRRVQTTKSIFERARNKAGKSGISLQTQKLVTCWFTAIWCKWVIINNYWKSFFVISGIIKIEVSVISRSRRLRLITLTETLIILDIPNLIIVLLHIVFKKITTNALSHRKQFVFDKPSSYFAVLKIDIALGNHTLRMQPTDCSLIC